jgi:hypothetical protein
MLRVLWTSIHGRSDTLRCSNNIRSATGGCDCDHLSTDDVLTAKMIKIAGSCSGEVVDGHVLGAQREIQLWTTCRVCALFTSNCIGNTAIQLVSADTPSPGCGFHETVQMIERDIGSDIIVSAPQARVDVDASDGSRSRTWKSPWVAWNHRRKHIIRYCCTWASPGTSRSKGLKACTHIRGTTRSRHEWPKMSCMQSSTADFGH